MKRYIFFLFSVFIMISGCGIKSSTSSESMSNESTSDEKSSVDLTAEQRNYLIGEKCISEDTLSLLTEVELNFYLQGTGFELFNKSSGTEIKGIEYTIDDKSGTYYYSKKSSTDKRIDLAEAKRIRGKESDIRVDDFIEYESEMVITDETDSKTSYALHLPVSDYPNACIQVLFSESKSGLVKMSAPYMVYPYDDDKSNSERYIFSLLYDDATIRAFFSDEKPSLKGKVFGEVPVGCITENALALVCYNYSDKSVVYDKSYNLYFVDDENKRLIASNENTSNIVIKPSAYEVVSLPLDNSDETLQHGRYILEYGSDEDGFFFGKTEFDYNN